jgi:hypothetical protein
MEGRNGEITVELNIYTLTYAEENNVSWYTNTCAKAKPSSVF